MFYFHFFYFIKRDNLLHFITLMNTSAMSYTEKQLKDMLLSPKEKVRKTALIFIYQNEEWRTMARSVLVHCPGDFIEDSLIAISIRLKESVEKERNELAKKELSTVYKNLCTEYLDEVLVAMFKEGGSDRTLAMGICRKRFYIKILNILRK